MGFGLMFLGVLFLEAVVFFPDIAGFILILFGVRAANAHSDHFKKMEKVCFAGIVMSLIKLFYKLFEEVEIDLFGAVGGVIFGAVYTVFTIFFYLSLLSAICDISGYTGLDNIKRNAYADMLLVTLFLSASEVMKILIAIESPLVAQSSSLVAGTAMLLSLLSTVLVAIVVFRCYMYICVEGDEDMTERKNSLKNPFDYYSEAFKKDKKKKK